MAKKRKPARTTFRAYDPATYITTEAYAAAYLGVSAEGGKAGVASARADVARARARVRLKPPGKHDVSNEGPTPGEL